MLFIGGGVLRMRILNKPVFASTEVIGLPTLSSSGAGNSTRIGGHCDEIVAGGGATPAR
jgi:hypothetical protein